MTSHCTRCDCSSCLNGDWYAVSTEGVEIALARLEPRNPNHKARARRYISEYNDVGAGSYEDGILKLTDEELDALERRMAE